MADTLKNKFFSGIVWTLVQKVATQFISVIFTIVLARLLMPEDYGLIGMLSIFISISDVFIQSGFSQALIQKTNTSDEDYSTAFYFNFGVSVFFYFILFLGAPLIANFYHESQLVIITRILALNIVIGSLNIVQQAKLSKAMNFKALAVITLICTLISGIVGLVMAYCGFGVWALVSQTLTATLLRVFTFPLFTKWHPNRPFNKKSFNHLWGFGSKILVTGIFEVIINNLSNILIGRYYDKGQVGYFTKARNFAEVPATTMSSVMSTVLFPLLSEIHEDGDRHKMAFKKVSFYSILFMFPVMILCAVLAEPIVIILFTEKWAPCIPMLQAFLLARAFLPLNVINAHMLQTRGETKLYMNVYFITGPISILAIVISIPFGVQAMALATLVSAILYYSIFSIIVGKRINYSFVKHLWEWRFIFISLVFMSVGAWLVARCFSDMWVKLFVGGLVGVIIYCSCCKLFRLIDNDMLEMLKTRIMIGKKKKTIS